MSVETTRRSTIERKQWRCIRFSNHPAAIGRLHPANIWALQDLNRMQTVLLVASLLRGLRLPGFKSFADTSRSSRPFVAEKWALQALVTWRDNPSFWRFRTL